MTLTLDGLWKQLAHNCARKSRIEFCETEELRLPEELKNKKKFNFGSFSWKIHPSKLGMSKVSARWISTMLTPCQKAHSSAVRRTWRCSVKTKRICFHRLVNGDETVYHGDPESEKKSSFLLLLLLFPLFLLLLKTEQFAGKATVFLVR